MHIAFWLIQPQVHHLPYCIIACVCVWVWFYTRGEEQKRLESCFICLYIHPKGDQSWVCIGRTDVEAENNTLATWCEELTHLKRPWCWERLKAGGEGDHRGWDGWIASPTRWTWVWVNSESWWWTGRPGMLRFMGLQRAGHDWAAELNWTELLNTGFPGCASGKEPACQCRRHKRCRFDPWVRKIPWRRAWQPTPVFLPGESHGQRSLVGYGPRVTKSQTRLKWLSTHTHII